MTLAILIIMGMCLVYAFLAIFAIKWIGRILYKRELSSTQVQFCASILLTIVMIGYSLYIRTLNMLLLVAVSLILLVRSYRELRKGL